MLSLEIMGKMDVSKKNAIMKLWFEIDRLNEYGGLGCRATSYSIHRFIDEALDDDEFLGFILYGRKGGGKSTYAIKALATYYMRTEELPCGDAYQEALASIAFSAKDLMNLMDNRRIIVWDDAGLWGSTYMWYDPTMRPYLEALLDWYDVARTDVNVLIMTTPSKKKLPPRVREDHEAIIGRVNKNGYIKYKDRRIKTAIVVAAKNSESLYGDKIFRKELFRDYYSVFLPDPVYTLYRMIRKEYSNYARRKLGKIISVLEEAGEDVATKLLKKKLMMDDNDI